MARTMTLEEKGPIVKAPRLKGWAQKVSEEVQSWRGMVSATHWTIGDSTKANGADFYVNGEELGHIHLDGEIHMPLTTKLVGELVRADLAEEFPWGRNWAQFTIDSRLSAEVGTFLFKLGFDRINGTSDADLRLRIRAFSESVSHKA